MNTLSYQKHCLTAPIGSSIIMGGLFTGLNMMEGQKLTPRLALLNMGGLYCYMALICPMEAISGRQSAIHNGLSAGMIGYIGVSIRLLGVPFVSPYYFLSNPNGPSPPVMGAAVYGGMALLLSSLLGGKPL
jgi:hypothetical protein